MHDLQDLARRARGGDAQAAAALREALEGPMRCFVRRALRQQTAESPLDRCILAEVRRAGPEVPGLVGRVARGVCELVVGRLHGKSAGGLALGDTVRV